MNTLLSLINAASSGLVAIMLIGAILSSKVNDGIVIKLGLIVMMLGFGAIALRMVDGITPDDAIGLARSILLVNAGLVIVILGYLLRRRRAHHPVRRVTDFAELDTRPPMEHAP